MDGNLRETTNLCVEIMNSKRKVNEKLGHVIQICVCQLTSRVTRDQTLRNNVCVQGYWDNGAIPSGSKTSCRFKSPSSLNFFPDLQANLR